MYTVDLLVIWTLWNFVTGSDYLIAVHERSSVRIQGDESGGSVQVAYINYNRNQSRSFEYDDDWDKTIEQHIDSTLGYDDSTTLISCSNSAFNLTVYAGTYRNEYNIFSPLPVNALGTDYVVSSCHQREFEFSVLVITAYKVKADVTITFNTNLEFSYEGQTYRKGDTFRLSLRAYQTFTLRVRYDLSGTRIESTDTIAVFSGTANSTTVYTYTQLLPVELFSDEFVLAVNDSMPPFQLQIIGERSGFEITFNNGSLASTSSSILSRFLKENETFTFVSNIPVMVTLCRSVGNKKGHVLLLPTSMYINYKELYVGRTTIILAYNTADIDISHPIVTGGCKNISNTNFTVGIFSITTTHNRIYFAPRFFGTFITFGSTSFFTSDLSLAKNNEPIKDPSITFIIIVYRFMDSHIVAVSESEAYYQVWCSNNHFIKTRKTYPHVKDYFYIDYNRMCTIETNSDRLHFFLENQRENEAMSAPILPITSLGKTYVIPSYNVSIVKRRKIMLATGKWKASVNVTKKDDTVARYDLREYQTVTVDDEPCEMVVSASREIVVLTEHQYRGDFSKYTYNPVLIPSEDFGSEYVLAVGSLSTGEFMFVDNFTEEYYINITCLDKNATIIFSDGLTVTLGEEKFYHKEVTVNGSLHFTSSKSVMVLLCLKAELQYEDEVYHENPCTILPPVELYDNSAVISIPEEAGLKIMTKQDNHNFHAFNFISRYRFESNPLIPYWENIPNTDYKVGTAKVDSGTLFMKSTHKFTVIVNGNDCCSIPKFDAILSISTSSLSGRHSTRELSTNVGSTSDHTITPKYTQQTTAGTSELTSTNTAEDYQLTPEVELPSTIKTRSEVTSLFPTQANDHDSEDNSVKVGDNNVTTLIVGCVCGFIILVLGCIVGFLVIRLRRKSKSKAKADAQTSHKSATEQETSFNGHTTLVVKDQVSHGNKEEGGHTYSNLTSESQAVNEYESVDGIYGNRDTPQHANTYSDLVFEGQVDNEYEKIDHKRKNKRSDYENC